MVGEMSDSDLNQIYVELNAAQPGNDQSGGHRRSSDGSLHKASSDKSGGSIFSRKSLTRLGVHSRGSVPAPSCIQTYQDLL